MISLAHRHPGPELMDGSAVGWNELSDCLMQIDAINRWTGGHRPTLAWLGRKRAAGPLRILDVGCGAGGLLRLIARRAARQGRTVALTGIDRCPRAIRLARELTPMETRIRFVRADVFDWDEDSDLVVSTLFTHHLAEGQLHRYLGWMEQRARLGWFVNDLHRHPLPYATARLGARLLPVGRLVAHDAPLSVARAFTPEDWRVALDRAGLAGAARVRWRLPFRLCVERDR